MFEDLCLFMHVWYSLVFFSKTCRYKSIPKWYTNINLTRVLTISSSPPLLSHTIRWHTALQQTDQTLHKKPLHFIKNCKGGRHFQIKLAEKIKALWRSNTNYARFFLRLFNAENAYKIEEFQARAIWRRLQTSLKTKSQVKLEKNRSVTT